MRQLTNYFFRGLLFVSPIVITVYTIVYLIRWLDGLIPGLFPGLGLLIILTTVTMVGLISSIFLFNPVMDFIESIFSRTPFAKVIYNSIKDLFKAFAGNKKSFTQPVMVTFFKDTGIQKLGFITKEDLAEIGISGMSAVYFPHSYNFSGNLYLEPKENITVLDSFEATEALKFIVSGGITGIESGKKYKPETD